MPKASSSRSVSDNALLELQTSLLPLREIEEAIEKLTEKDPHLRVYKWKIQEVREHVQSALVAIAANVEKPGAVAREEGWDNNDEPPLARSS